MRHLMQAYIIPITLKNYALQNENHGLEGQLTGLMYVLTTSVWYITILNYMLHISHIVFVEIFRSHSSMSEKTKNMLVCLFVCLFVFIFLHVHLFVHFLL